MVALRSAKPIAQILVRPSFRGLLLRCEELCLCCTTRDKRSLMALPMSETTSLPFEPLVMAPRERFPIGSCDCHFHVFEDVHHYPLAAGRNYSPAAAPMVDYRCLMAALGVGRAALVQPTVNVS